MEVTMTRGVENENEEGKLLDCGLHRDKYQRAATRKRREDLSIAFSYHVSRSYIVNHYPKDTARHYLPSRRSSTLITFHFP